jgi:DNA invertase Pin-like site-specific DNA recombinase
VREKCLKLILNKRSLKMPHLIKAAIYCRVSRADQTIARQIVELTALAASRNWEVVETISEKISGAKAGRPGTEQALQLARAGTIQKLLVSEISRLGRSTLQVLQILDELNRLNVSVFIANYGIETLQPDGKRNPLIAMLTAILSEFATLERETLIERTKSGLAQAKRNGKILGRPVGTVKHKAQLLEENRQAVKLLRKGYSIRQVAKLADVSTNTVQKIKRHL